jgi:hypothetical protein
MRGVLRGCMDEQYLSMYLFAYRSGSFLERASIDKQDSIGGAPPVARSQAVFLSRGRQVPFHGEINTAKPSNGSAKRRSR